ncbi:hypothetical protein RRG08_005909 [Elysia crispata]|uniref:Uncharacterized protein n=1 Tax=Elysia crispata TaxID=231223 RepID=A0AAE1CSM4_9GAST|nr:hypothetical protein RRG08_005909 [Elysia crispata]
MTTAALISRHDAADWSGVHSGSDSVDSNLGPGLGHGITDCDNSPSLAVLVQESKQCPAQVLFRSCIDTCGSGDTLARRSHTHSNWIQLCLLLSVQRSFLNSACRRSGFKAPFSVTESNGPKTQAQTCVNCRPRSNLRGLPDKVRPSSNSDLHRKPDSCGEMPGAAAKKK